MLVPSFASRHAARGFTLVEVCFAVALAVAVGSLQISSLRSQAVQEENQQAALEVERTVSSAQTMYAELREREEAISDEASQALSGAMPGQEVLSSWGKPISIRQADAEWVITYHEMPAENCVGFTQDVLSLSAQIKFMAMEGVSQTLSHASEAPALCKAAGDGKDLAIHVAVPAEPSLRSRPSWGAFETAQSL